jgi:acetyl esterase/lipase
MHSSELGIDPNRIVAGGASAGGQVAAAAGTVKSFEEPNENLNISSKPNALVLIEMNRFLTSLGYLKKVPSM